MAEESLEVIVKWRQTGIKNEPVRIHADPDDTKALLNHLETIARAWGNHDASTRWLTEYEMQVRSIHRPWVPEFTVSPPPAAS